MATITELTVGGAPPVLGTFGKGVKDSVSVNTGESGGRHCERTCRHHPKSTADNPTGACYAVVVENRPDRAALQAKLARHEASKPEHILAKAIKELKSKRRPPPWLRVSTNGSLPSKPDNAMAVQWLKFGDYIEGFGMLERHHIPVESATKAADYRRIDSRLTIRESCQTEDRWINGEGPMSTVAGGKGTTLRERLRAATKVATKRKDATGRKVAVCPAVVTSFKRKLWNAGLRGAKRRGVRFDRPEPRPVKCGQCPLCSLKDVDIVYPLH